MSNPYSFNSKVVQRSKGKSAVAAAAYQAGEKLLDLRTGRRHNYSRKKQGVVLSEILVPQNAPGWARNRAELWNRAELAEKRKDGQPARRIILALPRELNHEQRRDCARTYIQEQFVERGMVADYSIHLPEPGKNQDNHHLHLLLTMRDICPEGFGSKNREWNQKSLLEEWRREWATHVNKALEKAGFEDHWDHRTLEAQGIDRLPQIHMGPAVVEMEQKGLSTDRADRAFGIAEANQLQEALSQIEKEIQNEQRNGPREASPEPATASRKTGTADPTSKPENHQAGKGVARHGPRPEKVPSKSKAKPARAASRSIINPQGGLDMQQGQQQTLARAFQAGIDSRKRQRVWSEHRRGLLNPPAGLTYSQIERRRALVEKYDWLLHPQEVRNRAVAASPQGGSALQKIEDSQRENREAIRFREIDVRNLQDRHEELKPLQILEKRRVAAELRAAEQALAAAHAEEKSLALAERKLITSCPSSVVENFRHRNEEERQKALADLLCKEAEEAAEERRREEAEAAARRERQAMRPSEPKKPSGWEPPRPG